MSINPLVSVIIPCYNHEKFIAEAIESALRQDYHNIEIIICDDASTDNTPKVIMEYYYKFPGKIIPILGKERLGITKNVNRGLSRCNGEFFAPMGGDDVLLPSKITKQVQWFLNNKRRVLCGHAVALCDENTRVYKKSKRHLCHVRSGVKLWIERGCLYSSVSVMIRTSCVPKYGFDERFKYVSDVKLYIDVLKDGGQYGYINEILAYYRRHKNNITNFKSLIMWDLKKNLAVLRKEFPKRKLSIRKAVAYLLYYGYGYQNMCARRYKRSAYWYIRSITLWPFSWKVYIRFMQLFMMCIIGLKS